MTAKETTNPPGTGALDPNASGVFAQAPDPTIRTIKAPTVSRHVWYVCEDGARDLINLDSDKPRDAQQPMDAVVCYVHNPHSVNLQVKDHEGYIHTKQAVPFVHPGDDIPADGGHFCAWMPYQNTQHAVGNSGS